MVWLSYLKGTWSSSTGLSKFIQPRTNSSKNTTSHQTQLEGKWAKRQQDKDVGDYEAVLFQFYSAQEKYVHHQMNPSATQGICHYKNHKDDWQQQVFSYERHEFYTNLKECI